MGPMGKERLIFLLMFFIVILYWWLAKPRNPSQFRYREADKAKGKPNRDSPDDMGSGAKQKTPLLTGISIEGQAHEILGVQKTATKKQIQTAYRELMKRYHPDKVSEPGTPQWQEAQKIAVALTKARDEMLLGK